MICIQEVNRGEILEAAMVEFAENGYSRANTNCVCAAAGVSKGLVFHYFSSKKGLYIAVVKKCVEETLEFFGTLNEDANGKENEVETDFVTSILKYYRLRMDFFSSHHLYYQIIMKAIREAPIEAKAEIDPIVAEVIQLGEKVLRKHFARLPVKSGVDRELALTILMTVLGMVESKHVELLLDGSENAKSRYVEVEKECFEIMKLAIYGMYEEQGGDSIENSNLLLFRNGEFIDCCKEPN